jgi:nucleolar protein 12
LRSVPFAAPTAASADTEEEGQRRAKREKERARAWKEQQELLKTGDKRVKEDLDTSKTYIDAKGKRRVAFIKKEVSCMDSM